MLSLAFCHPATNNFFSFLSVTHDAWLEFMLCHVLLVSDEGFILLTVGSTEHVRHFFIVDWQLSTLYCAVLLA